jgi:hypothetical protein
MGRVECRDRLCEWTHRSDDRAQPSVPEPAFQRGQTGAVGFHNEKDCASVVGPHPRWFGNSNEGTARTDQFRGAIENLTPR